MTKLSLANPIAIVMACVAVIVFSLVVTPRLSIDTFPELTPPVLVVGTLAPGLGPKDVEKTLTWRIEKYVSATPGVDHVQSLSRNNLAIIFVWLKWGTDLNAAQGLVQQQVAFAMAAVPKTLGVLPPFVLQYDPSNAPVVQVAVSGGGAGLTGSQIYDFAVNTIEPVLEGIPGVASASPNGGRQRQINVVIDAAKAQARGLTSTDIAAAVSQTNALVPSGSFVSPYFDANVYTNAVASRIEQIGDAIIKSHAGKPVTLRDVASVEDSASPQTQAVSIDGQDAVYLNVLRVPGGNTLQIVERVKEELANLKGLPAGMVVKPIFDQSTFVRTSFEGLRREILQALLLISLVILLFLQSGRAVVIACIAIPISFAVILIALYATGQTLNAFTLGGLTLSMGPLVDISVVVLESIHRHRARGKSALQAAADGAGEVALPALAATLTTLAVLLPVLLLYGLAKKLFAPLALTVAVAMVTGYIVSLCVTPVACRYFLGHGEPGPLAARVARLIDGLARGYTKALEAVLRHRGALVAACAVLVGASMFAATRLPSTFFPEIDESMERVYVRLPAGTSLEETNARVNAMGAAVVEAFPKGVIELYLANVGYPKQPRSAMGNPNNGPHMGFLRFALCPPEHRDLTQRQIADRIREVLNEKFPGAELLQWPGGLVASVFSNGFNAPIVVELRGNDLAELAKQQQAVAELARTVPGMRDVMTTLEPEYPEVRINLDRQAAGMLGVQARAVAQTTLESTYGNINGPSTWVDPSNGMAYYVVSMYDARAIGDPDGLARVPVKLDHGAAVTLGAYATVERSLGPIAIERNQLQRAAHVYMQTEGRDIGTAAEELEAKLKASPELFGADFSLVGQVELMRKTFSGLGVAIGLAVMVVFMIMATQFKSVRLPLIMLFTIPCALVGIVLALLAAGQGFSVIALMGVLMVVGIAVSNGILLVDHASRRLSDGSEPLEAVLDAARTRFVPIMMTSLATVVGLMPVALGLETGAEANRPLALAVVGGLTSSTALSLFLVPAMFLFIAKKPALAAESDGAAPRLAEHA
ncbi:MAG: efflux RND transporter permease subunit [Myxococcaceae bacterium]|nr:efflux RND transporter permease subunit [Myxococcaceae bacterium]